MKKVLILIAIWAIPFLLVWMTFILTGFSFSPREVFNSSMFWGLSAMYWLMYVCIAPVIVEEIN
jgi:hypothetical protein